MAASPDSLLKYDPPLLVVSYNAAKKKTQVVQYEPNPQQGLIDFMDSLLPPIHYTEANQEYDQHVSITPTSRSDVIKLEEQLEQLLKDKKARDKGICPIRSGLFEDCMNELIREVALDLRERGSLLKEVRDEMNQSIIAYEQLYESAVAHGIRKAIHGEQNKNALKKNNESLEDEIKAFENKIIELQNKIEDANKNDQEETAAKDKDHAEKVAALRAENAAMRKKLEDLLAPNSA